MKKRVKSLAVGGILCKQKLCRSSTLMYSAYTHVFKHRTIRESTIDLRGETRRKQQLVGIVRLRTYGNVNFRYFMVRWETGRTY